MDLARVLAGSLADLGVDHACISPGSRSTPLALAFGGEERIGHTVHHDERSAGFFALGRARATGKPVVLVCTSGTAAANYLPAVVEAHLSRVPLLILTANRPAELRDVGAPQAIDQVKLFGDHVRWFHQTGPADPVTVQAAPALAAHGFAEATGIPPGPVHLDVMFREPLAPPPGLAYPPVTPATPRVASGRVSPTPEAVEGLRSLVGAARVLVVAGPMTLAESAGAAQLAGAVDAPILADPLSGLRHHPAAMTSGDLLATAGALGSHAPDVVIRLGGLPTSKAIWRWLEDSGIPQVLVDAAGWRDPLGSVSLAVRSEAAPLADVLIGAAPPWGKWQRLLIELDRAASSAVDEALATMEFPNEPAVARVVTASVPPGGALHVASSMPVRDVDAFGGVPPEGVSTYGNRGTNGIDGSVSTALGIAGTGTPTVALIGDVAMLHDLNALSTAARLRLPLTVVVVHNDGGGIFSFLPQASPDSVAPEVYEKLFGTPHGTDFVAVATALGLPASQADTPEALRAAIDPRSGPALVQVHTDRTENVAIHHQIRHAVSTALTRYLPRT